MTATYTPCGSADSAYDIAIWNETLFKIAVRIPWLHKIGMRAWRANATFLLQGGKLCYVDYRVRQWPDNDDNLEIGAETTLTPSEDNLLLVTGDRQNRRYGIHSAFHRNSNSQTGSDSLTVC